MRGTDRLTEAQVVSDSEAQAELRRIVREAVRLHYNGQLSEADFRALVTHAMALDLKVSLDETFTQVNQDINRWMERIADRVTEAYYTGAGV